MQQSRWVRLNFSQRHTWKIGNHPRQLALEIINFHYHSLAKRNAL